MGSASGPGRVYVSHARALVEGDRDAAQDRRAVEAD
jgi:hypothetical protein